jgi:hypothetical protein
MKLSAIIIGFGSLIFATTNAGAAVGENIAQLKARYGAPDNGLLAGQGLCLWLKAEGGVGVFVYLEDGKAAVIYYEQVLDEEKKKALLEQNLPSGQTWGNSDSFKDFMRRYTVSDTDREEVDKLQYWQTADGSLWAIYSPKLGNLGVGTPEGWKKFFSAR